MQTPQFANIFFGSEKGKLISLIDAAGFREQEEGPDGELKELKRILCLHCDHLNIVAIAVNGHVPRVDRAFIEMIHSLIETFGETFWSHAVFIVTRVSMDKKSRYKRKSTKELVVLESFFDHIQEVFPGCRGVEQLMIDSLYDKSDEVEKIMFERAMERLWSMLEKSQELGTAYLIQQDVGESKSNEAVPEQTSAAQIR